MFTCRNRILYRSTLVVLMPMLMAACAAQRPAPAPTPQPRASVNYRTVPDKHIKHYTLTPSQSDITPDPSPNNPEPAYPPDLVANGLPPVTVDALLVVDAQGRVQEVRIASETTDDPRQRRFDQAVRKAVMQWRFTPYRIADWVTDANGDEHRVDAAPKPFSQAYRFYFEVQDGTPRVSGAPPAVQR